MACHWSSRSTASSRPTSARRIFSASGLMGRDPTEGVSHPVGRRLWSGQWSQVRPRSGPRTAAAARSRSSTLRIFMPLGPSTVGNSSTSTTRSGTLNPAIPAAQCSRSSSSVAGDASRTKATATWPEPGRSTPTTWASSTAGCRSSRCSISAGSTRKPRSRRLSPSRARYSNPRRPSAVRGHRSGTSRRRPARRPSPPDRRGTAGGRAARGTTARPPRRPAGRARCRGRRRGPRCAAATGTPPARARSSTAIDDGHRDSSANTSDMPYTPDSRTPSSSSARSAARRPAFVKLANAPSRHRCSPAPHEPGVHHPQQHVVAGVVVRDALGGDGPGRVDGVEPLVEQRRGPAHRSPPAAS